MSDDRPELVIRTDPGWIPARIIFEASPPQVEWWFLGARRFVDPFMVETLNRSVKETPLLQKLRFRTPPDALRTWAETSPGLAPSGFIFHLSRCGSTVASRALASDAANRVLSEPWIVGNVMAACRYVAGLEAETQADWLRWTLAVLGRPLPGETRFFIKFNAWATPFLPLLRGLYPDTPWVFMYRDPLEVMASHAADHAIFMKREFPIELLGLDRPEPELAWEDHIGRVLGAIGQAVLASLPDPRGRLVDYRALPGALPEIILPHFGLDPDPKQLESVLQVHAKRPGEVFKADGQSKREGASEALRAAAERWVAPVYRSLVEASAAASP